MAMGPTWPKNWMINTKHWLTLIPLGQKHFDSYRAFRIVEAQAGKSGLSEAKPLIVEIRGQKRLNVGKTKINHPPNHHK